MQILFRVGLCMLLLSGTGILHAQAPSSRLDLSITYVAEHSLKAETSQDFWMQGGSIELGANVWRGLGIAADVTGTHTGSIGSGNLPFDDLRASLPLAPRPASLPLRPGTCR